MTSDEATVDSELAIVGFKVFKSANLQTKLIISTRQRQILICLKRTCIDFLLVLGQIWCGYLHEYALSVDTVRLAPTAAAAASAIFTASDTTWCLQQVIVKTSQNTFLKILNHKEFQQTH